MIGIPHGLRSCAVAVAFAAAFLWTTGAIAAEKVRVAKAVPYPFAYTPLDVGIATGAFQKQGLDIEASAFTSAARLQQALASDSVDIGIGGGTDMAFIAKGAPVMAIAAQNLTPVPLVLLVAAPSPIKSVADLKGRTVGISSAGSVIDWMPRDLARLQGWGYDGIKTAAVGDIPAQVAALKTRQIDGIVTDLTTGYRLEASGDAKIFLRFSDYVKDFINGCIYARKDYLASDPNAVRAFLAGWFDAVAFMRSHRDETIKIVQPVMNVTPDIAARTYDQLMPAFSGDGRFPPSALKVMAQSFVDVGVLPAAPDMGQLYTEAYLPKSAGN